MKFAQRSDVAMFLVAQGKPVNYVKAAVNESFNYEDDGDIRDLCYTSEDDPDYKPNFEDMVESDFENEFKPCFVTEEEAIKAYNTMEEMFSVENNVICLDGEPLYDINGDHLP